MKSNRIKSIAIAIFSMLLISKTLVSCSKENNSTSQSGGGSGTHNIDPKFVGKWMWTKSGASAYYSDNGVYQGAASGMATQFNINADGTGTAYDHIFSTIGVGVGLEVNISYKGFFESDAEGHLGFFPTSGTYKSSSGENRALRADELYNEQTGKGRTFLYQKVLVTTQGGRACFQTTASNGTVDTFFKVN